MWWYSSGRALAALLVSGVADRRAARGSGLASMHVSLSAFTAVNQHCERLLPAELSRLWRFPRDLSVELPGAACSAAEMLAVCF